MASPNQQSEAAAGHDRVLRGQTRVKRSHSEAFSPQTRQATTKVLEPNDNLAGTPRTRTVIPSATQTQAVLKKRDMKEPEEPHTPDCPFYPARTEPLPTTLTCYELCHRYPNHLFGAKLDPILQHGFSASAIHECLPSNFRDWLKDLKKGKNGNWGNKYTKNCKTQDLDRNEVNVFQKRIDKRKMKLRKDGQLEELMAAPKLRVDGRPTVPNGGGLTRPVRSRSNSSALSEIDTPSLPSPYMGASTMPKGLSPTTKSDTPEDDEEDSTRPVLVARSRAKTSLTNQRNSIAAMTPKYQYRPFKPLVLPDHPPVANGRPVPEYEIVNSNSPGGPEHGNRSVQLNLSNQAGGILGFTTVRLPIIQAPNGAIVQLKPRLDFHGHVKDIDEIRDSTIRSWYEKPTFDGISAEPAFTLPNGKIYDIFIEADVVGHTSDWNVSDAEVRDVLGLPEKD